MNKKIFTVIMIFYFMVILSGCQTTKNFYKGSKFSLSDIKGKTVAVFSDYWAVQMDATNQHNELIHLSSKKYASSALNQLKQSISEVGLKVVSEEFLVGYGPGRVRTYLVEEPHDSTPEEVITPILISNPKLNIKRLNRTLIKVFPLIEKMSSGNLKIEEDRAVEKKRIDPFYGSPFDLSTYIYNISDDVKADYYLFFLGSGLDQRLTHKMRDLGNSAKDAVLTTALTFGRLTAFRRTVYKHEGSIALVNNHGDVVWYYNYQFKNGNREKLIASSIKRGFKVNFK